MSDTDMDCSLGGAEERWIIGQIVTVETTERTYDVYSDDWDFAYSEEEPNDEDVVHVVTQRGPRITIDDVGWTWELLRSSSPENVDSPCTPS